MKNFNLTKLDMFCLIMSAIIGVLSCALVIVWEDVERNTITSYTIEAENVVDGT